MTKGRLLFTVLTAGIFIGCTNPFAGRSDAPGSDSTVRLDSLLPQELTEPAYTPTDSLRKQLGGPLFEAPDPDDSITLLEIERNIYAGDTTLCYRYIEHNRAHPVYRWFENDSLKGSFPEITVLHQQDLPDLSPPHRTRTADLHYRPASIPPL